MTKQDRDNYVGVSSIQTLLKGVEVYVNADGGTVPEVNGLSGEPLYDALNLISRIGLGAGHVARPNLGQQNSLMALQHWYNIVRTYVNENKNMNLHPMEIDGEWCDHVYHCFNSVVQQYRQHHTTMPGQSSPRRQYHIMDLSMVSFEKKEAVDEFHKLVGLTTGVENVPMYLSYMRNTGWRFGVGLTDDGYPVGVVAYLPPNPILGNKDVKIAGLYVSPDHRQCGVGKALVSEVIIYARHLDVTANKDCMHLHGWDAVIGFLSTQNVKM